MGGYQRDLNFFMYQVSILFVSKQHKQQMQYRGVPYIVFTLREIGFHHKSEILLQGFPSFGPPRPIRITTLCSYMT